MADLISRAAALDVIDQERKLMIERNQLGAEHVVVHHARRQIEELPAADAVPVVHAEWVVDGPGLSCSACKEWVDSEIYYMLKPRQNPTYCPYCGAKMDGEVEK